ncbi:MAG: hypothetical protein BM560_17860 [Roseobacter sp. MedPE-SWde]|nr:MAG: hypothetical protein BM560_17860 [Roseobacter sp. MedPE-SWde]
MEGGGDPSGKQLKRLAFFDAKAHLDTQVSVRQMAQNLAAFTFLIRVLRLKMLGRAWSDHFDSRDLV